MAQSWWLKPLRFYQSNLRLIDGGQDPAELIRQAKEISANAMVVNAAGAYAYYPTELDCQVRVPTLKGDLMPSRNTQMGRTARGPAPAAESGESAWVGGGIRSQSAGRVPRNAQSR